jgi:hypothetical protein
MAFQSSKTGAQVEALLDQVALPRLYRPVDDFGTLSTTHNGWYDITAALQSAFNNGECVYLSPEREYAVSNVVMKSYCGVAGAGWHNTIIHALDKAAHTFEVVDGTDDAV